MRTEGDPPRFGPLPLDVESEEEIIEGHRRYLERYGTRSGDDDGPGDA